MSIRKILILLVFFFLANVHDLHKMALSQEKQAFKVLLGIFVVLVIGIVIKVIFYGETCPSDAKLKGELRTLLLNSH